MARNNSFTCTEIANLIVISHIAAKPRQCPIRIIERALTDFRSRLSSSDRRGDGDTIVERRPEVRIKSLHWYERLYCGLSLFILLIQCLNILTTQLFIFCTKHYIFYCTKHYRIIIFSYIFRIFDACLNLCLIKSREKSRYLNHKKIFPLLKLKLKLCNK